jgi:hypothetical protein
VLSYKPNAKRSKAWDTPENPTLLIPVFALLSLGLGLIYFNSLSELPNAKSPSLPCVLAYHGET